MPYREIFRTIFQQYHACAIDIVDGSVSDKVIAVLHAKTVYALFFVSVTLGLHNRHHAHVIELDLINIIASSACVILNLSQNHLSLYYIIICSTIHCMYIPRYDMHNHLVSRNRVNIFYLHTYCPVGVCLKQRPQNQHNYYGVRIVNHKIFLVKAERGQHEFVSLNLLVLGFILQAKLIVFDSHHCFEWTFGVFKKKGKHISIVLGHFVLV